MIDGALRSRPEMVMTASRSREHPTISRPSKEDDAT